MNRLAENYRGILAIGDPHVEHRVPDFRKDDYPHVVLDKIKWSLRYAKDHCLLPLFLGDLFHRPRNNINRLLGKLITLFADGVLGIYGNHDVGEESELTADDSLDILVKAGKYLLLNEKCLWHGKMNGHPVVIGGTSWKKPLPKSYLASPDGDGVSPLVFWLTHHDIYLPGYEKKGRCKPKEISGIDVVINGHIHRRLEEVQTGSTRWITPGSIIRRTRSDANREHIPSVLRIDIHDSKWKHQYINIPHQPFDEVFHEKIQENVANNQVHSVFASSLQELLLRKTDTGAALTVFLEDRMGKVEPHVAEEIWLLHKETIEYGNNADQSPCTDN